MQKSWKFKKIKRTILNVSLVWVVGVFLYASGAGAVTHTSCTTSTVGTACRSFATSLCAGGSVACGSYIYNGTTYTNRCYCTSCGSGVTGNLLRSTDGKILACGCSSAQCSKSNSTNSSTHLVTTSYSSTNTAACWRSLTASSPTTVSGYCSSLGKTYSCASGYGSIAAPTSTTKCYSCTGKYYWSTVSSSTTPTTYTTYPSGCELNYYLLTSSPRYLWKAYDMLSFTGMTVEPFTVTNSDDSCASTSYLASSHVARYYTSCVGIVLRGCKSSSYNAYYSTTCRNCSNTIASNGTCKCKAGYYGSSTSCSPCPAPSDTIVSGAVTSSVGSSSVTGCYMPSGMSLSDSTGEYDIDESCPYES